MPSLLEYLKVVNELDEETLAPIKAHYNLSNEIKAAEEAKKQAAMDEEYEKAAQLKKKIISLKDQVMTADKLRIDYIEREPIFRMSTLLESMSDIDPIFTKTFLDSNLK